MGKANALEVKEEAKKEAKERPNEKLKVTLENKCDLCTGSICCTYITHQIDKPKSMKDFDYLLWQISHNNVSVFKDDDGWFLSIKQSCTHLLEGGRCGIYESRPAICREHSNECCEYDGPAEEDFKYYFDTYESLYAHCQKKFKKWDSRFRKWGYEGDKKGSSDKKNKKDKDKLASTEAA